MDPPNLYRYPVQYIADPAAAEAQRREMATLEHAIATTPEENLRFHVKFACTHCPFTRQRMCEALLAAEDEIPVTEGEDGDSSDDGSSATSISDADGRTPGLGPSERRSEAPQTNGESSGEPPHRINNESASRPRPNPMRRKTFVPRYAICEKCDEEFDVTENSPTSCNYHPTPGKLKDEELQGPGGIDKKELSKLHPEKLWHECCGGNGEEPCAEDWHREKKHVGVDLKKRKRRKLC